MITKLNSNEIFVFGSNLAGNHAGGAAAYAVDNFGAEIGVGEGLTGKCYAFPTLGYDMGKLEYVSLKRSLDNLYKTCREYPSMTFLLTPVGTGIAGFTVDYMKHFFENPPSNLVLPEEFK